MLACAIWTVHAFDLAGFNSNPTTPVAISETFTDMDMEPLLNSGFEEEQPESDFDERI
jgi:hypothetical protein